MQLRGTLGALALASLFVFPSVAWSAIVQKWKSTTAYFVVSELNDLNADGNFEMLTEEPGSGGNARIGVRSTSTGGLLSQTAGSYAPSEYWITYLEPTNEIAEVLFLEHGTGYLTCLNYTSGLSVRWSFKPVPTLYPTKWLFIDFDGTSQMYMVFQDPASPLKYYVYNNNGVLTSTIDQTSTGYTPQNGWANYLSVDDFDNDGRQELMIRYHNDQPVANAPPEDVLYVFESNAPGPQAVEGATQSAQHPHAATRKFERIDGHWSEAGPASLDAPAAHAVRLP